MLVCRRAIEIVELEQRQFPDSPDKKVTISHVSAVCSQMFSSQLTTSSTFNGGLPLQQKLIVCTLMASLKDSAIKQISITKVGC